MSEVKPSCGFPAATNALTVEPVAGGDTIEMQGRFMDVAKNVNGNWLYIADHASVPAVSEE